MAGGQIQSSRLLVCSFLQRYLRVLEVRMSVDGEEVSQARRAIETCFRTFMSEASKHQELTGKNDREQLRAMLDPQTSFGSSAYSNES